MALLDPTGRLPGLDWRARDAFLKLGKLFRSRTGLDLRIRDRTSGRRTCADQNAIYAQGREREGPITTQAYGCQSWHVLARAIDADPVDPTTGRVVGSGYNAAGALWEELGGKWGGRFPGFPDVGHFEWHPGVTISDACPVPGRCSEVTLAIVTEKPRSRLWLYALGGLGLGALALWAAQGLAKKLRPRLAAR